MTRQVKQATREAPQAPGGAVRSRRSPQEAADAFRDDLANLGAILLEPMWLGVSKPHRARCAAGHICNPNPYNVSRGAGICRTCSGYDPAVAEAAFRARLARLGATPLYARWLGNKRPHHVVCAAGHESYPMPISLTRGQGICRTCAGQDPAVAEAQFRARLHDLGVTPLFVKWLGVNRPHHVRCIAGHDAWPYPANVRNGEGPCRVCRGCRWDALYVVTSPLVVKFGITSGDPRPRLAKHARRGYATVVRLHTGLPGTVAPDAETAIVAALAVAGEQPVQGKEYFDVSCLGLVVDIADSYAPFGEQS
jgi:hypothetical protein